MSAHFENRDPDTILFSQATISGRYATFDKPVEGWEDCKPYNLTILIVQHGELLIVYDSRRLVSARWIKSNGDPQHEITSLTCRIK